MQKLSKINQKKEGETSTGTDILVDISANNASKAEISSCLERIFPVEFAIPVSTINDTITLSKKNLRLNDLKNLIGLIEVAPISFKPYCCTPDGYNDCEVKKPGSNCADLGKIEVWR